MKSAKGIVATAWHITLDNRKKLFKFGFIPSFFSILITGWYIFYQIQAFRHSAFFHAEKNSNEFWMHFAFNIWGVIGQNSTTFIFSIIIFLIILGGWFFIPMLCRAAITQMVGQAWRGEPLEKGFSTALLQFFPLFEINATKRALEPISFITELSFVVRHIPQAIPLLTPLLLFFGVIGIIGLFFLIYTTQIIVLHHANFIEAVKESCSTVLKNFTMTLKILVLFFLVELRIVLNILLILAVPVIIATATGVFATLFSHTIGIVIGVFVFFLLFLLTAYLTGIIFVFSEAILTVAFLELKKDSFSFSEKK